MEKVKVLVVEDEAIIADALIAMISKMGYECIGSAFVAEKALEMVTERKPDVILLDIRLKGEKTGIWLAQQIKKELDIPYIFMTSFSDKKTVEQAASTIPYGYLVKPVKYENVFAAIATALIRFSYEKKERSSPTQSEDVTSSAKILSEETSAIRIKDVLFVKDEYQYVKVTLADIDFIKSDGNYVEIHCGSNKKVIKETLKNFESRLDSADFFQVHRSYIVNLKKIERIGGNYLIVNHTEVPVTKEKRDELFIMLNALQ